MCRQPLDGRHVENEPAVKNGKSCDKEKTKTEKGHFKTLPLPGQCN